MPLVRNLCLALAAVFLATAMLPAAAEETVSFAAADKVKVFATYRGTDDNTRPIILLFHQAGSNHAEYDPIAVRLVQLGYNTLAVDQRSGGARWGATNRTVDGLGRSAGYEEALRDLEAALAYAAASRHAGPAILWGSSYSASLVFLLAARHPDAVKAVLAFSPGEYLGGADTVRRAAAKVKVPVFVTSASDAGEIGEARAIVAALPGTAHGTAQVQYVPKIGVHGSSTLRNDQNERGAEDNWKAVEAFFAGLP